VHFIVWVEVGAGEDVGEGIEDIDGYISFGVLEYEPNYVFEWLDPMVGVWIEVGVGEEFGEGEEGFGSYMPFGVLYCP